MIQPSQFYIDQLKLEAVSSFINIAEDVIIPLGIYNSHYVALDGHTRMYCAYQRGFKQVLGYDAALSAALNGFIIEAQRRNIRVIADLPVLLHQEYEEKWNHYCEEYFKQGNRNGCL
ncbi:hypothetical protein SDC9_109587 [bioreactor metagenome]|uniref:ParB/Sulfiredoxin domain-containing protein n=1 Tax=bioreactor metagenome TaxID=1076179 RepID=A0A645BB78_9ZZZZ